MLLKERVGEREITIDASKKSLHWYPEGINNPRKSFIRRYHMLDYGIEIGYEKYPCEACHTRMATWIMRWIYSEYLCNYCMVEILLNRSLRAEYLWVQPTDGLLKIGRVLWEEEYA